MPGALSLGGLFLSGRLTEAASKLLTPSRGGRIKALDGVYLTLVKASIHFIFTELCRSSGEANGIY